VRGVTGEQQPPLAEALRDARVAAETGRVLDVGKGDRRVVAAEDAERLGGEVARV
jgi:hypothetical protein